MGYEQKYNINVSIFCTPAACCKANRSLHLLGWTFAVSMDLTEEAGVARTASRLAATLAY